jgi:DNA helicase IV
LSNSESDREQEYVSMLYRRLDELRDRAAGRLAGVLRESGGTHQARTEREAFAALYTTRLARFDAAEHGLCFGRLEFRDGELRYIGRLGIHGDTDEYEQLLMDWRADAARPFYLATVARPENVKVRRHLKTRGRTVISLDDEVLDPSVADPSRHDGLTGESALLAAMSASRTGRMSDIVATIQAEQDEIIRSALAGVLVVQGGPGTGKTAVALHRAAYLLYTHRSQLEKRGVLLVGPNATFLRYIGQVLPSLGETSVLLSTVADIYPGITATGTEPAATAEIKGRPVMAGVIAAAVADRQALPDGSVEIVAAGQRLRLSRRVCARVRERARRSRRPHNQARRVFAAELVSVLARQAADRIGADLLGRGNLLGADELDDLRGELAADRGVRAAIDQMWPVVSPQRLVSDLFADPGRLSAAAPGLTEAERAALRREPGGPWTPADIPLLDEAAELLGEDDLAAGKQRAAQRRAAHAYAQGVLDLMGRDIDDDAEVLMAADLVDAGRLAARQEEDAGATAAERAATDRTWAFGHVIVDEAQELSAMAWRLLMRRCPAKSMTIVGDVAQTGDLAGPGSWGQALEPELGDRWRLASLTINYRTPAEIMAIAADVLAAIAPGAQPPRSVRESGAPPWRLATEPGELPAAAAEAAQRLLAQVGDGKLAVIVPEARLGELGGAVGALIAVAGAGTAIGTVPVGEQPELDSPVVVLAVRQAKGLEFDAVLIVEPEQIIAASPRGLSDLYVALTRATSRLGVVHTGAVPAVLDRLADAGLARAGVR